MILIDNRVGSVELEPFFSRIPHSLQRLEFGDFAFTGNGPLGPVLIGIERKTWLDFVKSMESGRLSGHQIVGMLDTFNTSYLVIEGIYGVDNPSGMLTRRVGKKWESLGLGSRRYMARDIFQFIASLEAQCGVIVKNTSTRFETVKWIHALFTWWQKPWDKHRALNRFNVRSHPKAHLVKPGVVTRVLSQLDGIGWERATEIAKHFDSVADLVAANVMDLITIPGVGRKLAESIIQQLTKVK